MNSKRLFVMGYILLFGSFVLAILVFSSPTTVFTLPKDVAPGMLLAAVDATPTFVFFAGVGVLLVAVLKQRAETTDEL